METAIAALQAVEQELVTFHHENFPEAQPPRVPAPAAVDEAAILRTHTKAAVRGVGLFDRNGRREAKQRGKGRALHEIGAARLQRLGHHGQAQTAANAAWNALVDHDPDAVMAELEEAFEDNQYPAACLGATRANGDNRVSLLLLIDGPDMIPEKAPARALLH